MSDDWSKRVRQAVNRATTGINQGTDAYDGAAYGGSPKTPFDGYAAQLANVIVGDSRLTTFKNQGLNFRPATFRGQVRPWLDKADTYWVHCYFANAPSPARFRVYVCARLDQTHNILRQLLERYTGTSLHFKVAAHAEAQQRNDTIVSWHAALAEANLWADTARANAPLLEGAAPAVAWRTDGIAGVGIDVEIEGDTSTMVIARAAHAKAKGYRAIREV